MAKAKTKKAETNWEELREKVKKTDKEVLKKAIQVDGHTIYEAKKFTDAGLDPAIVAAFSETTKSGKHPKEQLFDNAGMPVKSVTGVYGLPLLQFIAGCFEVTTWKMGRGSAAQHLIEQLEEKFK